MTRFKVGDRVRTNPLVWRPTGFDPRGAGLGTGLVVEPPFPLEPGIVDVRWPAGRCFQAEDELLPVDD